MLSLRILTLRGCFAKPLRFLNLPHCRPHSSFTTLLCHRRAPSSMIHFYAPRGCSDELPDLDDVTRTREIIALPQEYTALKPLKRRAEQIIHTDGSVRDAAEPEFYRSGSGVYRPPSNAGPCIQLCINPIGDRYGVANTIQRAEMVGVKHALSVAHSHSKRITATDSLCAMYVYMISKHLRCPSLHKESKHLDILDAAVKAIAESLRAGSSSSSSSSTHSNHQSEVPHWHQGQ